MLKLYHSFESSNGFDINKYDFARGLFCIKPWWVGKPGYEKYSAFHPNEFGDKVVEITVDENVKTYVATLQIDVLEKIFPDSEIVKQIVKKYETGDFERKDWQALDKLVGQQLLKKDYEMIHYTQDEMYGDVWAILDKKIIKSVKYES